jgi:hypothetical protein
MGIVAERIREGDGGRDFADSDYQQDQRQRCYYRPRRKWWRLPSTYLCLMG